MESMVAVGKQPCICCVQGFEHGCMEIEATFGHYNYENINVSHNYGFVKTKQQKTWKDIKLVRLERRAEKIMWGKIVKEEEAYECCKNCRSHIISMLRMHLRSTGA